MLIAFRGRNTVNILADAKKYHLPVGLVVVVCRENDSMAEPGDISVGKIKEFMENVPESRISVIANGGTTQQLMTVIAHAKRCGKWITCYDLQSDCCDEYYL